MSLKPSEKEEQFFKEQELRQRKQKEQEQQQAAKEAEERRLKALHWLHCPKCGQALRQEHYGKVEVDICQQCKGLWLDANELEQIIADRTTPSNPFNAFLKTLGL